MAITSTLPVTTSSFKIGVEQNDLTTDCSAALQELLDIHTHIVIDTIINLAKPVATKFQAQILEGAYGGNLRPITANMADKVMVALAHQHCRMQYVTSTNPQLLKANKGGRQGTVDLRADYCVVDNCTMINQLNAVTATSQYRAHGSRVTDNRFLECLGAADGDKTGEDRGDAVTLWGSGSVIMGNFASCKAGEDARLAFHAEAPVSGEDTRPEFKAQQILMVDNMAYGTFRRHFVMEGISHGVMMGNVSLGGATWWCEALIMCTNVITQNTLKYTRTKDDNQGGNWAPKRGAIACVNYNTNCVIRSNVLMAKDSVGSGFVMPKASSFTNKHGVTLEVSMENQGDAANYGFQLEEPNELLLSSCKSKGFSRIISTTTNGATNIQVTNCTLVSNGTGNVVYCKSGTGGKITLSNSVIDGTAGDAKIFDIANLDVFVVNNCGVGGKDFFGDIAGIKNQFSVTGNYNLGTTGTLQLRYGGKSTLTDIPTGIEWFVEANSGISSAFCWGIAQLEQKASALNSRGKTLGMVVATWEKRSTGTGEDKRDGVRLYYATSTDPTSPWVCMDNSRIITPA